jgi:ribosomal protein S18 acetylase RimI-like enzyme
MAIRQYQKSDFNRLAEIYDASRPDEFYAEEGNFTFVPWAENNYMMTIFAGSEIYVYEEEGVVGFCGFTGNHINWFFVHPDSRGKGIGDKLLTYLLTKLERGATLSVWKSNERAKSLYKKHGFLVYKEFYMNFQGRQLLLNRMVYA